LVGGWETVQQTFTLYEQMVDAFDIGLLRKYITEFGVRGITHIGANECQELEHYKKLGFGEDQVVWVEAIPAMVDRMTERGVKNIYSAVIDETQRDVVFNVTNNNGLSSSILELGTHKNHHPNIDVVQTLTLRTSTLKEFLDSHNLPTGCSDMLVLDVQGAELRVLRGSPEVLKDVKIIVTEINTEEVYKGAGLWDDLTRFLKEHGFVCVRHVLYGRLNYGDALYVRDLK
jgi:FkbM family methyltransferase